MAEPLSASAVNRLIAASEVVLADVTRMPSAVIHWRPAEGVWTVMDNLCHIREFVPFWVGETMRIVHQPTSAWGRDHNDADRLAAVADTTAVSLDEVVADIRASVWRAAETLRTLSDADLAVEATSRNPRWATKPASFVVDELLVHHVEKHGAQIRRNLAQYDAASLTSGPAAEAPGRE